MKMERGVLYIATGDHKREAVLSAYQLKRVHPDIPVALVSEGTNYDIFDESYELYNPRYDFGDQVIGIDRYRRVRVGLFIRKCTKKWEIIEEYYSLDQTQGETESHTEPETAVAIENGDVDVVYGSIESVIVNNDAVVENTDRFVDSDEMVARGVSNNIHSLIGYPFVNGDFYREHEEVIDEFLSAFLEGYSAAAHWAFANPDEAIDAVVTVMPGLYIPEEVLLDRMRVSIVTKIGPNGFNEGVGGLNLNALSESLDLLEPIMAPDEGIPDVDDLVLTEPSARADLKTFSDEEEAEIREFAADFFEAYDS